MIFKVCSWGTEGSIEVAWGLPGGGREGLRVGPTCLNQESYFFAALYTRVLGTVLSEDS